jgi:DNA-directed RNA polymerase
LPIDAAVAGSITSIATVHDSFDCLAAQAERFRRIIREQFVELYEKNDVLAQVLECARMDLKDLRTSRPRSPSGVL